MPDPWTPVELKALELKFGIRAGGRLHPRAEDYHFPCRDFLREGYAPPGGYVKDFSVIWHDGRLHLFHIDGRPGEPCWITGNEISLGHASTSDLRHWIRHPMPLAVGERPWESEHVWAPFIFRADEVFHLFYMGSGQGQTFISYATSRDLETWVRSPHGPITSAIGRDPFIYPQDGKVILLYTGLQGATVCACASADLESWTPLPDLLKIPSGVAAESTSLHSLGENHVLWFNDYGPDLEGFRAAYVISSNPDQFKPGDIREFEFTTSLPHVAPSPEFPIDSPVPISIELVKRRNEDRWLVAYFRWHIDRNRLFFGELNWQSNPARIREISDADEIESWLIAD